MKNRIVITTISLAMTMLFSTAIPARSLTGLQVVKKVYDRPAPKNFSATLKMVLYSSSGSKRSRVIKQFIRDNGRVEKKIMFFQKPADVKNTSFMSWSYASGKADDQWIYLPALKRIKRISSDSKGDYFMGSDFTYDDLGDRNPNDDRHKIIRQEKFKDESCYVIVSTPKKKNYMYSKTVTWIVKGKWIGLKKIFYDEDGELLKTLTVNKYKKIGRYLILTNTKMVNKQNRHQTSMNLSRLNVKRRVANSYFSERRMRRGTR